MPHKQPHHIKRIWVLGLSLIMMLAVFSLVPRYLTWSINEQLAENPSVPTLQSDTTYSASVSNTVR